MQMLSPYLQACFFYNVFYCQTIPLSSNIGKFNIKTAEKSSWAIIFINLIIIWQALDCQSYELLFPILANSFRGLNVLFQNDLVLMVLLFGYGVNAQ